MIIDAHTHLNAIDGSYEEAYAKLLADMEQNGISKSIIIADNVTDSGCADTKTAIAHANYKCLVIGSPNILIPKPGEFDFLEQMLLKKKIVGLKFFPGHDAYYANDERCNTYFELALKFKRPVIFHTGMNSGDSECAKYNDPKYIVAVAKRYPSLNIVISHYFWPKMDYCYELTRGCRNIYFDTSAMADPEVVEASGGIKKVRKILERTLEDNPASVLFGTDYSMCDTGLHLELIDSLDVKDHVKEAVLAENAQLLFDI